MLTRRQLRIKVMQAVFSFQRQRPDDLKDLEKFINSSMTQSYTLFLYMAQLLVKIHEVAVDKHTKKQQRISKSVEHNPSRQFIDNKILLKLRESEALKDALKQRNLNPWHLDSKYVENLYNKIQESKTFVVYAMDDEPSVKKDLKFLTYIYEDIIAPSDELMDYLEDVNITWTDDYPLINSTIIQFLRKVKPAKDVVLPALLKDDSDAKFTMSLFRKTILNIDELSGRIVGKTPNWDTERIAQIDLVLIMMAQAEFLYFSDIPVKVTLNEYLEIAILDNLLKEFEKSDELNKMGRGLM